MDASRIRRHAKKELAEIRAHRFIESASMVSRTVQDYKDDPGLLHTDLAWVVMEALCVSHVSGVSLDIEASVSAGQDLFNELTSQGDDG